MSINISKRFRKFIRDSICQKFVLVQKFLEGRISNVVFTSVTNFSGKPFIWYWLTFIWHNFSNVSQVGKSLREEQFLSQDSIFQNMTLRLTKFRIFILYIQLQGEASRIYRVQNVRVETDWLKQNEGNEK